MRTKRITIIIAIALCVVCSCKHKTKEITRTETEIKKTSNVKKIKPISLSKTKYKKKDIIRLKTGCLFDDITELRLSFYAHKRNSKQFSYNGSNIVLISRNDDKMTTYSYSKNNFVIYGDFYNSTFAHYAKSDLKTQILHYIEYSSKNVIEEYKEEHMDILKEL